MVVKTVISEKLIIYQYTDAKLHTCIPTRDSYYSSNLLTHLIDDTFGCCCMLDDVINSVDVPAQVGEHPLMAKQDTDAIWPAGPKGLTLEGENYYSVFAGYILGIPGYEDLTKLCEDLNTRYNAALDKGLADGTVTAAVYPNFDPTDPTGTM